MSGFDPDNNVGGGGGSSVIKQGGNVSSKLPGRQTFDGPSPMARGGVASATAGGQQAGGGGNRVGRMLNKMTGSKIFGKDGSISQEGLLDFARKQGNTGREGQGN